MNDFDRMIKNIEKEILDSKTASQYTSIRSVDFSVSSPVYTGLYRVVYNNDSEPILSFIYMGTDLGNWGIAYPRTPSGNTQIIEVDTTFYDAGYQTGSVPMVVVSNVPVISITRI